MLGWYLKTTIVWTAIIAILILTLWQVGVLNADAILQKRSGPTTLLVASLVVAAVPGLRFVTAVGAIIRIAGKSFWNKGE